MIKYVRLQRDVIVGKMKTVKVTSCNRKGKKGKVLPIKGYEAQRGNRGSSTLSLTSALDGGGWLTPRPGRYTSGKESRYPMYSSLGGPQRRSGRMRKISPPTEFDPRTVQPKASPYTDCAIPTHRHLTTFLFLFYRIVYGRLTHNSHYVTQIVKHHATQRSARRCSSFP